MAGQVLVGSEAGSGDNIAQDSSAKITAGGGWEAGLRDPIRKNTAQRFRGEILVQPS